MRLHLLWFLNEKDWCDIDSLDIDCVKFHIGISNDNYVKKLFNTIVGGI